VFRYKDGPEYELKEKEIFEYELNEKEIIEKNIKCKF
jgi:hypothetical protein